jgi:membrane fusion protein (multidrug efflux system)
MSDDNKPQITPAAAAVSAHTPARSGHAEAESPSPRKRWRRLLLLVLGPVAVLAAGAYIYLATGRYAATDNAYIKADIVMVSAEVAGPVARVAVRENQRVQAGDVLFVVDEEPYRIALTRAQAQLQAVQTLLDSLKASYQQKVEELELARTNVAYAERELARQQALSERKLASDTEVDRARHDFDVAKLQVPIVEQQLAQLRAQLGGEVVGQLHQHAAYLTARATRESAELDLERATVRAPFDGVASNVPMIGQYVAPGGPVMSIVADQNVWIEANYKETDLTHVIVGQPVGIHVDTYPDRTWQGEVQSIGQATGAEFSVIPAQNATGNWVKVAQRIPVRITVHAADADPMLRAGMSAEVEIDTGYQRELPAFLSFARAAPPQRAVAATRHP